MRYFAAIAAITFLSGGVASSVLAQQQEPEWVGKPVQCASIDEISKMVEGRGLQLTFAGTGFSKSVNFPDPIPVYVFLGINPDTKDWAITEVNQTGDEGCMVEYGTGFSIDGNTMKNLVDPGS